jgi:hypothetical protein
MFYYAPASGAITEYTQALTISVAMQNLEGLSNQFSGRDYLLGMTGPSRYAIKRQPDGAVENLLYGGYRHPHGAIEGQARITAAVTGGTTTALTVDVQTDRHGAQMFFADQFIVIMNDLPKSFSKAHHDLITFEALQIDSGYTTGLTFTVQGMGATDSVLNSYVVGAIVQPMKAFHSSLGLDASNGLLAHLSKPTTPTGLSATTATTQIDSIAWAESAELRDTAGGGTIGGYDIYVLKDGQGICANGMPTAADFKRSESLLATLVDQNPTPSASVQTVTNVTQYYNQSTNVLTTIDAGTYYVILLAKTASDIGDRIYYSEPAFDFVVVT